MGRRVARVMVCLFVLMAGPALADDIAHLTARPRTPPPAVEAPLGILRLEEGVVYVPRTYQPGTPSPLLVVLHGAGQRGADMVRLFLSAAEVRGVIVVAPDATDYTWDMLAARKREVDERWGPRYGADPPRIDALLALVFARYAVNPARVALAGFSDGATYTLSLGPENLGLFRTLIAFSPGRIAPPHTRGDSPGGASARIFISHGKADRVLPLEETTRATAPALGRHGFAVEVRVFEGGHVMPPEMITDAADWWLAGP